MATHNRIEARGFGTFKLKLRSPRSGTGPDGSAWATPERYEVDFKPAPVFRRLVEEVTGKPCI